MSKSNQGNQSDLIMHASKLQRAVAGIFAALAVLSLGFLWFAGHDFIEPSSIWGVCGFQQRYNLPCPTCGWTTAGQAFMKGEILKAFYIQPSAALVCVFLVIGLVLSLIISILGVYFRPLDKLIKSLRLRDILIIIAVVLAGGYIVTIARALTAR